jgi:hypothetical protein
MSKGASVFCGLLIVVLLMAGCGDKECKKGPDCGKELCRIPECIDNVCVWKTVSDCCGNLRCESGENYDNCALDCPECNDNNLCTTDSYDHVSQECRYEPVTPCCGNGVCDRGAESRSSCPQDCPDCNDRDSCTRDSYDYNRQACKNEPITPCCGNGRCEEEETLAQCPADCPNCDDNDPLTVDTFNYYGQRCEHRDYSLLRDSFDSGTGLWSQGGPGSWQIYNDNGNNVFRGTGYSYNSAGILDWGEYSFDSMFKIITGTLYVFYRANSAESYVLGITEESVTLYRDLFDVQDVVLAKFEVAVSRNTWHTLSIAGLGDQISVYLDGRIILTEIDSEPLESGWIGFEVKEGAEAYVDDVVVQRPH